MRILHITPFFQHPLMHGSTRHYYFIRELSQRHQITLLTLTKSPIPHAALQNMANYTDRIFTFDATNFSLPAVRNGRGVVSQVSKRARQMRRSRRAIKDMKLAFLQLVEQESYDVVVFHGKSVFSVIEGWDKLPIVMDFCDATSLRIAGMMRYAAIPNLPWLMLKYIHIRKLERKMVKKSPHLAFISARDREAILGSDGRARIVPNIVDVQYWRRKASSPQPNCIMFSGGMDYQPNVDGALYLINRILPLVREAIPEIRVLIVGRDPAQELLEAARSYPDITVTGAVEDMRPYFEQASVFVAPLRFASGQQNKLLEAMAMEVPVVTSPVAAAGVRVDSTEAPVLVAAAEQQFADRILHLITSGEVRKSLAANGRRFIEAHFGGSWSAEMLERICLEAISQTKLYREQG